MLLAALAATGKDIHKLTPRDLAAFDNLHVRGRAATRDLDLRRNCIVMSTQEYFGVPLNRTQANAIYTDAMSRMYGLVALGVITTGVTIWIGDMTSVGNVFLSLGWIGWQDI